MKGTFVVVGALIFGAVALSFAQLNDALEQHRRSNAELIATLNNPPPIFVVEDP